MIQRIDDEMVVSSIIKWMGTLMVISGLFAGFNSDDAMFQLACAASILFGFLLQTAHLRRKKPLNGWLIFWNALTTVAICWLTFVVWKAKYGTYGDWFTVVLFISSFMSTSISEGIYSISKSGIRSYAKMLARKWLSDADKKEDEI